MPIEYQKNTARFKETVGVEEAESLLEWLQKHPKAKLDLSACDHLHAADLQVLMAANPAIVSWPQHESLTAWIKAALR